MPRKMLEISIAVFLLTCTLTLLVGLLNVGKLYADYQAGLAAQQKSFEMAALSVQKMADRFAALMDEQAANQKAVIAAVEKTNTVFYETGLAAAGLFLEQHGAITPSQAGQIMQTSLQKLDAVDPRLGTLARAVNDSMRAR